MGGLMKRSSGSVADGAVPAVASGFVPGLGQLMNGESDKALGVFVVAAICGGGLLGGILGGIPIIGGVVLEPSRDVPSCNPDLDNLGCPTATGAETPLDEREAPDVVQPLLDKNAQVENPYNGGHYEQGYILLSTGVTYTF